jgi:hypothetical protein
MTALIALASSSSALELDVTAESDGTPSWVVALGGDDATVMVSAGGPATRRTSTVELRGTSALPSVCSSPARASCSATLSLYPRPHVRPWPWRAVLRMRFFGSATETDGVGMGTEDVWTSLLYR